VNLNRRIVELFDQVSQDKEIVQYLAESDYYTVLFACSNLGMTDKLLEVTRFAIQRLEKKSASLTELAARLQEPGPAAPVDKKEFDRNAYLIINLYKNLGRYDKAVALLKESCAAAKSPDPCMELCDIYREQGSIKKARTIIKKLRKQYPASSTVKNFHAYFLALENKDLDHALELSAATLTGEDSDNPAYLDTYGFILLRSGRVDEAGTFLEKAYARHPFEKEIMEHLAQYYRLKKQENRVLEIYRKAVEHNVDFKDRLLEKIEELENKK
jgi:tetratricopeptide (TPR) repeat protein